MSAHRQESFALLRLLQLQPSFDALRWGRLQQGLEYAMAAMRRDCRLRALAAAESASAAATVVRGRRGGAVELTEATRVHPFEARDAIVHGALPPGPLGEISRVAKVWGGMHNGRHDTRGHCSRRRWQMMRCDDPRSFRRLLLRAAARH